MFYIVTTLYPAFINRIIQSLRRPQITLSGVSLAYLLLSALHIYNYILSSGTRLHARYLHELSIPSYM
jgi:hypothetical protein